MLGKKVRDKISGFEGIVTAKTEWLYGCVRYGVQSQKLKKEDGTVLDEQWFDETQLDIVEGELGHEEKKEEGVSPGGSRKIPPRTGTR